MTYNPKEKTYLAIGLIEFFKDVKEYEKKKLNASETVSNLQKSKVTEFIKWESLTGYIIDCVIQGGLRKGTVPNKYFSKTTFEKFSKAIDSHQLDPLIPEVLGGSA